MQNMHGRVVLITGASSGIGAATAGAFAARGWRVFGTSRTPSASSEATLLPLDVRDDASVNACVAEVERRAGRIDALVNNAGELLFGPIEEVPLDAAHHLFETNFWGVARMVDAALPILRRQQRGHIINVGSIAGTTAIPLNGFYAASKHALRGYTEALRHEVHAFGVRVSLVAPGDFRTRLWEGSPLVPSTIEAYVPLRDRVMRAVELQLKGAEAPHPVAVRIVELAESDAPPLNNAVGGMAKLLPLMKAWMPEGVFERGVRRRFIGDGRSR
jgi:NAD(P)-dependent dehydrogenase (short-subunit alcohol dehydrogenase family)